MTSMTKDVRISNVALNIRTFQHCFMHKDYKIKIKIKQTNKSIVNVELMTVCKTFFGMRQRNDKKYTFFRSLLKCAPRNNKKSRNEYTELGFIESVHDQQ